MKVLTMYFRAKEHYYTFNTEGLIVMENYILNRLSGSVSII